MPDTGTSYTNSLLRKSRYVSYLSQVKSTGERFLVEQNWLSVHYLENGPYMLFNVTMKSHAFWHCCQQSWYQNPRTGWCYREESFVGKIARIILACLHLVSACSRHYEKKVPSIDQSPPHETCSPGFARLLHLVVVH